MKSPLCKINEALARMLFNVDDGGKSAAHHFLCLTVQRVRDRWRPRYVRWGDVTSELGCRPPVVSGGGERFLLCFYVILKKTWVWLGLHQRLDTIHHIQCLGGLFLKRDPTYIWYRRCGFHQKCSICYISSTLKSVFLLCRNIMVLPCFKMVKSGLDWGHFFVESIGFACVCIGFLQQSKSMHV